MHVESERRDYGVWQESCHEGSVEARRQVLTHSGIHSEVTKVANKNLSQLSLHTWLRKSRLFMDNTVISLF